MSMQLSLDVSEVLMARFDGVTSNLQAKAPGLNWGELRERQRPREVL